MLAELAVNEPATFASLVETAKKALPETRQRAEDRRVSSRIAFNGPAPSRCRAVRVPAP